MSTSIPTAPARPAPKVGRVLGVDKRFLAPILITGILTVGQLWFGILESYWATGLAILSSILMEMALGRVATGRWPHLASAYVTGISVGILVRSLDNYLWPYVLCSLLSISSKYALRINDRHLWNPSNLGVSVLLFLLPQAVAPLSQQWGNEWWPVIIIWCLGSLILLSLGRLHITLTYAAAFVVLSLLRSRLTGSLWVSEIALLTAPSYQLFMFFMITDPKSTTRTKGRQCAVAVFVAVVETVLRLFREIHAPYYALFIAAPVTNLLEIWWDSRHPPKSVKLTIEAPSSEKTNSTAIQAAPPKEQGVKLSPGVRTGYGPPE